MIDEEKPMLSCARVDVKNVLTQRRVEGSIIKLCSQCFAQVWVSPSGQPLLSTHQIVCVECTNEALIAAQAKQQEIQFGIAPGAKEELEKEQLKRRFLDGGNK